MRLRSQSRVALLACGLLAAAGGVGWAGQEDAVPTRPAKTAAPGPAEPEDPSPPTTLPASEARGEDGKTCGQVWLTDVQEGYRRALADGKPVLVRAGNSTSAQCRALAAEIEKPAVEKELSRWTLVYLDMARSADQAPELGIELLPALRIVTARGRLVASHDGLLPAEELVAWLEKHRQGPLGPPDDVLLGTGRPDAVAVVRLVRQFGSRDPAIREAAVRRLQPYPREAAIAVVKAFGEGNLGVRLAALEVLQQWKAPVEPLDPWRPETLTAGRMAALEAWARQPGAAGAALPEKLSEEQLTSARRSFDRMLQAAPSEADAICERLARLGPALLPEVYARLGQATTDRQHQRLLVLRYRLVSSDSLVLRWPEGLVRLATADSKQRQSAAEQLARLAGQEDQRLLLELFSDPDPLVREISLRGLQHIGGKEVTAALVELLKDPEPNVRAAVLKQLAENPMPDMVPRVAEYLETEKDPDLIVHAIRFLRTAEGRAAAKSLMSLLKHPSWQVRAEAAEALGMSSSLDRYSASSFRIELSSGDPDELTVDAYVALIELLDDPEAFVVSRAVEGLSGADMAVAVEPLVKAAEKHPDLASSIVAMLGRGEKMRAKAIPHLRRFCKHENPLVRGAAVAGLCEAAQDAMQEEMLAALQDSHRSVRIAAAAALFELMEAWRNEKQARLLEVGGGRSFPDPFSSGYSEPPAGLGPQAARLFAGLLKGNRPAEAQPARPADEPAPEEAAPKEPTPEGAVPKTQPPEDQPSPAEVDQPDSDQEPPWEGWLKEHYAAKGRYPWAEQVIPLLKQMLTAEAAEERLAAAMVLVPLGEAEVALPAVVEAARSDRALLVRACGVLPWLPFQQRLDTFNKLREVVSNQDDLAQLIFAMVTVPDRRAIGLFWELLADEQLAAETVYALQTGLQRAYSGASFFSAPEVSPAVKKRIARDARARVETGSTGQRLAALSLLASAAPDEAAEFADRLANDLKAEQSVRLDAFQIALATKPQAEAIDRAIAALSAQDDRRRTLALSYLVHGPNGLDRSRWFPELEVPGTAWDNDGGGKPIVPLPPPRLKAEHVRPLLNSPDKKTAAYAGHLLALFGESQGLEKLIAYWRTGDEDSKRTGRLVYRAIASLDDTAHVPLLDEIYRRLEKHEVNEFYWTIRVMSGSEILRLRAKIREEVGMDNLR